MNNVLVFEDDFRLASEIRSTLESLGYAVTVTDEWIDALNLCRGADFVLLVVDLFVVQRDELSPVGGIGLIRHLRKPGAAVREWWPQVPILAVSGGLGQMFETESKPNNALRMAMDAGATATLAKPFTSEAFKAAVIDLMGDVSGDS